jgi:putative ABC transport system substrate-binding protein
MRIRTAGFIVTVVLGLLATPLLADTQQAEEMYRIGVLSNASGIGGSQKMLQQYLREVGYVEGKNLVIEWRFSNGDVSRHPELAADLVRLQVDCIIPFGVLPTRAAKQATRTIPIVMANADDDPVRQSLVASLERPGGNVTGFFNVGSDLSAKRLELLKETIPKLSRVAILFDPASVPAVVYVKKSETAAHTLGVQLRTVEVRVSEDLEDAMQDAVKWRVEALLVVHTGLFNVLRKRVAKLAIEARLPTMHSSSRFVLAGGLMSYSGSASERLRGVVTYVDRILKGAKPGDLPVQQPLKFDLVVNLKTARQLGITIPPIVLYQATRVIQ